MRLINLRKSTSANHALFSTWPVRRQKSQAPGVVVSSTLATIANVKDLNNVNLIFFNIAAMHLAIQALSLASLQACH